MPGGFLMPRTSIAYTEPSKTGTALPNASAADVTNGNQVLNNDGRVYVIAKNANVSTPRNLIVTPTATVDGLVPPARTSPIPASTSMLFGPWEVANYSTTLLVSGDNATDVSLLVLHIPG
jgi:hypothetical protein